MRVLVALAAMSLLAAASCTAVGPDIAGGLCPAGAQDCGAGCISLSDAANCGGCGIACAAGQFCSQGLCGAGCAVGETACGASCFDFSGDALNCGGCGIVCAAGTTCSAGVCGGGVFGSGSATGAGGTAGIPGVGGSSGIPGTGGGGPIGEADGTGYWASGPWGGCAWTGVDKEPGTTTTIAPQDFTAQDGGPYCVSGTVHALYESVALLGFNLAQPQAGANCYYDPSAASSKGPPEVALGGTGLAIAFSKKVANTLRVQIQGENGATDPNDRWCYTITDAAGPVFAPYEEFYTECWGTTPATKGTKYAGQTISAVVFLTPGKLSPTPFDFCIEGFAAGTSVADAPVGGNTGPVTGTIGGAGSTDLDFERVKIKKDGKSYVIQNNNWGNPGGSNQTLTYSDNSFVITGTTGGSPGNGVPASFPSIFIGSNGDTAGGVFSTKSDDGLPKRVSSITSLNTTFTWTGGTNGGDYNAAYDVWFAKSPPSGTYEDGIDAFLMVWLYKPGGRSPIGSIKREATIGGTTFDVWVGPRNGSAPGSDPNAPVVSYVAKGKLNTMTFDLKAFMTNAAQFGSSDHSSNPFTTSLYLTDVFAGFEIWSGGDSSGLSVTEFSAVVQ